MKRPLQAPVRVARSCNARFGIRRSSWVLPLMILAGCSAHHKDAPAVDLSAADLDTPPAWTGSEAALAGAATTAPIADEWWRQFESSELDELIAATLERNPDLRQVAAAFEAAVARARIDGAALAPQIGASLGGSRRKQNFIGFPIPGSEQRVLSTTSTNLGLSLNLSWEVDLWGRLSAVKAAGYAEASASEADLAAAWLSLAGQASKAWFATVEARQQVELAERTVESRRMTERRVRARYESGVSPSLELRQARTQTESVLAQLAARQQALDSLRRQLEILRGDYPSGDVSPDLELPAVPPPLPAGVPAELVARRPDLHAAERRAYAASARLRSARRALYPSLSLTGSTGTASGELQDLARGDFSVWSLAASLLQPVFQGGRLRAGVDLAQANLTAGEAAWLATALQAYFEVESALAAERFLEEQAAALAEATRQSQAAERLALERYQRGVGDYLSVLESQRSSFLTESQLLAVRRQRLQARVDLILALGGGYEPPQPGDSPPSNAVSARASR